MSISRFQDISVFDLTRLGGDGDLSKVEVDEMLGLVGDVRAEVSAGDAVPSWDVLLDVVLLNSLCCDVDGVLLHVFRHVGILDDGLASIRHVSCTCIYRLPM